MTHEYQRDKTRNDRPDRSSIDQDEARRPYDTDDLDKVPRPTEDDPPYRPWWVI